MDEQRLKLAIQKSGRLTDPSLDLLVRCGLKISRGKDQLMAYGENMPLDVLFVRDDDIPDLVQEDVCDLGLVGLNVLEEKRLELAARGHPARFEHVRTLDLVIVAAEWGYGRRHGWLSNYHLAARDVSDAGFAMIGKTFKGLTDDQFREMTERLLALKTAEHGGTVFVEPKIVVEVAYNDIQRSPTYSGGMALRFARIVRIRDDKSPEEADTLATVAENYERQILKPLARKQ